MVQTPWNTYGIAHLSVCSPVQRLSCRVVAEAAGQGARYIQGTHESVATNYCFYTYTTPSQYLGEFEGIRAKPKQGKVFSKEFYLQSRSVYVSFIICGDVHSGNSMGDCKS